MALRTGPVARRIRSALAVPAALFVVAGAGAGVAACGSSDPSPLAACSISSVTVVPGATQWGLGHIGYPIVLRHHGSGACTLHGYPIVWGYTTKNEAAYPAPATEQARDILTGYLGGLSPGHTKAPTVTLRGSATASFFLEGLDYPPDGSQRACTNFHTFVISFAHSASTVQLATTFPACIVPYVHPFVSGPTGNLGT
jgi:hypothetical protein